VVVKTLFERLGPRILERWPPLDRNRTRSSEVSRGAVTVGMGLRGMGSDDLVVCDVDRNGGWKM